MLRQSIVRKIAAIPPIVLSLSSRACSFVMSWPRHVCLHMTFRLLGCMINRFFLFIHNPSPSTSQSRNPTTYLALPTQGIHACNDIVGSTNYSTIDHMKVNQPTDHHVAVLAK